MAGRAVRTFGLRSKDSRSRSVIPNHTFTSAVDCLWFMQIKDPLGSFEKSTGISLVLASHSGQAGTQFAFSQPGQPFGDVYNIKHWSVLRKPFWRLKGWLSSSKDLDKIPNAQMWYYRDLCQIRVQRIGRNWGSAVNKCREHKITIYLSWHW
jgi:hypothetical protein